MILNVNQVWRLRSNGEHVLVRSFNHNCSHADVSPCQPDGSNATFQTKQIGTKAFVNGNYEFVKKLETAT